MNKPTPSGGLAVMQNRRDPMDSLDFFPTPPWATRALMECVLDGEIKDRFVWEPAAGAGHMAEVLSEQAEVFASDVHDYGKGYAIGSFVGEGADVLEPARRYDWIITNPPFNLAVEFAERALTLSDGVALLVRSAWLEGGERYTRLFSKREPNIVAQFCERVPMVKGRWDPGATTATSYCWVIWDRQRGVNEGTIFTWIPPGQRKRLTRSDDIARFTRNEAA
jgi:predicted RNA methylase